tara:strand:+ start:9365 stop:10147 length:783 start_codon:yes stop_codon:yes gene_type:complete
MIISHKYKYLFIGLPFSASSAISQELYIKYDGKPYLGKHSIYHEFVKLATKEEKKYFVFAVLRNPMEIAVTVYEKMRLNYKGNFTNKKLLKENGGYITNKQIERFNFIRNNNATFQEYFIKYHTRPYDNLSSITLDNCDFVIRHENIEKDYITALNRVGIHSPRPLPFANTTKGKNKNLSEYYTDEIKKRAINVFGPFMKKYEYSFPSEWGKIALPYSSILKFKFFGILKRINQIYFKKYSKKKSIKGSIYGDMQRNEIS